MLGGCVRLLLLWGLLSYGFGLWLGTEFGPRESWFGGLGAGLPAVLAASAAWGGLLARGDVRRIRRAQAGEPPRDRRHVAVVGSIGLVAEPVYTPFSRQACAIYEYEVRAWGLPDRTSPHAPQRWHAGLVGHGLAPCGVHTTAGIVRLLGFPLLPPEMSGHQADRADDYRAAREYFRTAVVEDMTKVRRLRVIGGVLELLDESSGHLRSDWQLDRGAVEWLDHPEVDRWIGRAEALERGAGTIERPAPPDDEDEPEGDFAPELPLLVEKVVLAGAEVCALGVYDETRRGLLPRLEWGGNPVRLFVERPEALVVRLAAKSRRYLVCGLVVLLLVPAVVGGVIALHRRDPEVRRNRQEAFEDAVRTGDVAAATRLLERGWATVAVEDDTQPLLGMAQQPAMVAMLLAHGADVEARDDDGDTPLIEAAHYGRGEVLRLLLAAGADVDARNPRTGRTALISAREAGHRDAAELLLAAGAEDDVVTADRGHAPIDRTDPAVQTLADYWRAIQARDGVALARLSDPRYPVELADAPWDAWGDIRPHAAVLVWGYVAEQDATLTAQGATRRGFVATWIVQLRRIDGLWRVVREHWAIDGFERPAAAPVALDLDPAPEAPGAGSPGRGG